MRKEALNWPRVESQVTNAVKGFTEKRFVNVRRLCEYVDREPEKYPDITGTTFRSQQERITQAMYNMGWQNYNSKGSRIGRVFIVPWIPEDPLITAARNRLPRK